MYTCRLDCRLAAFPNPSAADRCNLRPRLPHLAQLRRLLVCSKPPRIFTLGVLEFKVVHCRVGKQREP